MATVDLGPYRFRALFRLCSSTYGRAVGREVSGMQKHIYLVHLGCSGTGSLAKVGSGLDKTFKLSPLSDSKEDFHYTEFYVGMDITA